MIAAQKRIIDLRKKSYSAAKRIMKRILLRRDPQTKEFVRRDLRRPIQFILPTAKKPSSRNYERRHENSKCPYCDSRLVTTEMGVVCTGENLRYIAVNIEMAIKKWGRNKAEMFMSKKSLRFLDYYNAEGAQMTCTYILGTEEKRWRINNRILSKGVDRKTIFGSK